MSTPSPDKLPQEVREAIEAVLSEYTIDDGTKYQFGSCLDSILSVIAPLWHRPSPAASGEECAKAIVEELESCLYVSNHKSNCGDACIDRDRAIPAILKHLPTAAPKDSGKRNEPEQSALD